MTVLPARSFGVWHLRSLIAAICLLAQCAATFHLLFVQHVRCQVHGEWVHVENGDPSPSHARGEAADAKPAWTAASVEHHGDDHCPLFWTRRGATDRSPALPGLPAFAGEPDADVLDLSVAKHSQSICLFAPKTSPPA